MKTLNNIPDYVVDTFTDEEKAALEILADDADKIKAFYQLGTGEFDCIGFVGPGGKVTRFADEKKYNALLVLEERVRAELAGNRLPK